MDHGEIFRLVLGVVAFLASGHECHQWSSHFTPGTVKYACVGDSAMLPWTVALQSGESIHDIQWHFQGAPPSPPQTVAFYASGLFLAGPSHQQRVSYIPNAGILISGLTQADTGNYTVEVTGRNGSDLWSLTHEGILEVVDNALVSNGHLQVVQQPTAVYDNATGQWMVDLTCGDFPFPTQPPFDVRWTTPWGSDKPSSHYQHGQFHLRLSAAQASGNYSCHVTQNPICQYANNSGFQASLVVDDVKARMALLEAEVKDSRAASSQLDRLTQENKLLQQTQKLIEEQNKQLMQERDQLTNQNAQTAQDNSNLFQRLKTLEKNFNQLNGVVLNSNNGTNQSVPVCCGLNKTVTNLQQTMVSELTQLKHVIDQRTSQVNDNDQLCQRLGQQATGMSTQMNQTQQQIEDLKRDVLFLQQYQKSQQNVSAIPGNVHFQARSRSSDLHHMHVNDVLRLTDVQDNQGSGYNPATGVFTAPTSGTYFFVGSSEFHGDCQREDGCQGHAGLSLMASNKELDRVEVGGRGPAEGGSRAGTVHGVVHLRRGAMVWLQNVMSHADYKPGTTSFSGFLVSQD